MSQLAITFIETRSRRTDSATSREAAKNAASGKASRERAAIVRMLQDHPGVGLTARDVSFLTGIDYYSVQRRISECAGIEKTEEVRDGCAVWRSIA